MIMLTKVINKNKPEQRTKSRHIFFYLFKVCLFLFYIYMYTFKVKDLQEFQGVSRGKLCHFNLFILTFSTDSHHCLDVFVR